METKKQGLSLSFKNIWWIFLLIAAGLVLLLLSIHPAKRAVDQGVVLSDIFHQQPVGPEPAAVIKRDPVPPLAIVATPINGHETGFAIQVYSFQDHGRAEAALQSLKARGYKAFLVMSDLGPKGVWWRVRIGGIADEAAAHKMLQEIRKNYNSGFILKI
ncbi:MAG: SPOR domain-containing protein [Candidatus Omnitrophica bacterium]|nr:SPOR domain-containing protein [Candidatus Omnitrophota bacterium]